MIKNINWLKNEKNIKFISDEIKNGKIVVMPTDTIYGIITNAYMQKSINKIYKIKRRSKKKKLIVLISDTDMLKKLVPNSILKNKITIIEKLKNNPITFVVNAKNNLPEYIVDSGNIAFRIPKDKILQQLIKNIKVPLVAPSANISGEKVLRFPWQVIKQFKDKVDYIFWKLFLFNTKPSTIIDINGDEIKYIRKGKIKNINLN